jgi:predicted component of type VI protein secretion system
LGPRRTGQFAHERTIFRALRAHPRQSRRAYAEGLSARQALAAFSPKALAAQLATWSVAASRDQPIVIGQREEWTE